MNYHIPPPLLKISGDATVLEPYSFKILLGLVLGFWLGNGAVSYTLFDQTTPEGLSRRTKTVVKLH